MGRPRKNRSMGVLHCNRHKNKIHSRPQGIGGDRRALTLRWNHRRRHIGRRSWLLRSGRCGRLAWCRRSTGTAGVRGWRTFSRRTFCSKFGSFSDDGGGLPSSGCCGVGALVPSGWRLPWWCRVRWDLMLTLLFLTCRRNPKQAGKRPGSDFHHTCIRRAGQSCTSNHEIS